MSREGEQILEDHHRAMDAKIARLESENESQRVEIEQLLSLVKPAVHVHDALLARNDNVLDSEFWELNEALKALRRGRSMDKLDCPHEKVSVCHYADTKEPARKWACDSCGIDFIPSQIAEQHQRWLQGETTKAEPFQDRAEVCEEHHRRLPCADCELPTKYRCPTCGREDCEGTHAIRETELVLPPEKD